MDKEKNIIIKWWHIIAFAIIGLLSIGGQWTLTTSKVTDLEAELKELKLDYYSFKIERLNTLNDLKLDVTEIKTKVNILYENYLKHQK